MATAGLEVRLEPLQGALPAITWRRDDETEILSGGFKPAGKGRGASVTVELADAEGAIVVLDVVAGRLTGLDVVIWPALDPVSGLKPPAPSRNAEVLWPAKPSAIAAAAAVELETPLLASTNDAGTLLHLELGRSRVAETVRLADRLLADIDDRQRLAGLWLLELPQIDAALDDDEAYL
jgi:hypothetical protein